MNKCEACGGLAGQSAATPPHAKLSLIRHVANNGGNVARYLCIECYAEWTRFIPKSTVESQTSPWNAVFFADHSGLWQPAG